MAIVRVCLPLEHLTCNASNGKCMIDGYLPCLTLNADNALDSSYELQKALDTHYSGS